MLPVLSREFALGVAILGGVAACSAMVPVHVGGSVERPVATFGARPDLPERACVETLSISRGAAMTGVPIWSVETQGACRSVRQIVYGEVPRGFKAKGDALPLEAGVTYSVRADGVARSAVMAVPWHWTADYVFEDGHWKRVL